MPPAKALSFPAMQAVEGPPLRTPLEISEEPGEELIALQEDNAGEAQEETREDAGPETLEDLAPEAVFEERPVEGEEEIKEPEPEPEEEEEAEGLAPSKDTPVKSRFGDRLRPGLFDLGEFNIERSIQSGILITDEKGRFKLRVGGSFIGRTKFLDSGSPVNDEFNIERARLSANMNLLKYGSFRIQTELSNTGLFEGDSLGGADWDAITLKDAYFELHRIQVTRLRAGQFKVPFTFENLQSAKHIDFAERSIASNGIRRPSRDIGVMLHGRFHNDLIDYQVAVVNGAGENTSDDNSAKDLAARLVFGPFRNAENDLLSGLNLGVSGTVGNQDKDFSEVSLKTVAGTKYVTFAPATIHKGDRSRLGAELIWLMGPASVKAEWMHEWLDNFQMGRLKKDAYSYGWYASGSYLLTGEKKTLGRIVPKRPFSFSKKTWGAWELAARYSVFRADSDLFKLGMAFGAERAEAFTLGLNWYPKEYLRVTVNYEHTDFDGALIIDGKDFDDEDVFLAQFQLAF